MRKLFLSGLLGLCFGAGFVGDEGSPPFEEVLDSYLSATAERDSPAPLVGDRYLRKLISYYFSFEPPPELEKRYFRVAWKRNNSPAAMGFLNEGWSEKKKTADDYARETEDLRSLFSRARLKDGEEKPSRDLLLDLYGGLVAGLSWGYTFAPTTEHLGSYPPEARTLYAFKVGQQKIRDALLREYAERIALQEKELSRLYGELKKYCNEEALSFEPATPPDPDKLVKGTGTLFYRPVVRALEDATATLMTANRRFLKLQCFSVLSVLHLTKAQLLQTRLQLFQLRAIFSLLENEENALLEETR